MRKVNSGSSSGSSAESDGGASWLEGRREADWDSEIDVLKDSEKGIEGRRLLESLSPEISAKGLRGSDPPWVKEFLRLRPR